MLHRSVQFKTQSVAEDGTFDGYASVFGNKDLGGDIVQPGAFARTISDHARRLPLPADHGFDLSWMDRGYG